MIELVEKVDEAGVQSRALSVAERAKEIRIATAADFGRAASYLKDVKAVRKTISDFFAPLKKAANEAHRKLTAAEADADRPLREAETSVKGLMVAWEGERERIRQAEQRRIQEENRRAQEAARKKAEEETLAKAIAAEEAGNRQEAAKLLDAPVEAPAPPPVAILRPAAPRVAGISFSETWSAQVDDLKVLAAAVAAGVVPAQAIEPNLVFLNGQARVLKGDLRIPGVQAVSRRNVAAGGR